MTHPVAPARSGSTLICPACGTSGGDAVYDGGSVPAHSCVLLETAEDARAAPVGRITLALCRACGFIWNAAFDSGLLDYSRDYEESQAFSPRFTEFARSLADRLVTRHGIRGKEVLEIGCGKGDFLALLCEMGESRGVGVDPAYVPGRLPGSATERLTFVREELSKRHAPSGADLICCRHTLEHLHEPARFLELVAGIARRRAGTIVFFEVPDVGRILDELAFWDIYHEHCSYFTEGSLVRLFERSGFDVLDVWKDFDDQYVLLEARVAEEQFDPASHPDDVSDLAPRVDRFRREHGGFIGAWRERVHGDHAQGRRVALWGSGSKAVAFLTTLGIEEQVEVVVDINPFRHDMFLPTTGQRIVAPEFLRGYRPDSVIVMNPIYREEIARMLEGMGVAAELSVLEGRQEVS